MKKQAIIKDKVEIDAPVGQVWQVLTKAKYYRQWDDLPESFTADKLAKGAVIDWDGHSILTVVECKVNENLRLSMVMPKLDLAPSEYNVSYAFSLTEKNGKTQLSFEIGDFSPLPNPRDYVENTKEFVNTAKKKIKELAEQNKAHN